MRSFPGVASRLRVGLLGFADSDICAGKNLFRAGHKKSANSTLQLLHLPAHSPLATVCLLRYWNHSPWEYRSWPAKTAAGPLESSPYSGTNVADMVAKFRYVTKYYLEVKCGLPPETRDDNMAKMADWLLQNHRAVV